MLHCLVQNIPYKHDQYETEQYEYPATVVYTLWISLTRSIKPSEGVIDEERSSESNVPSLLVEVNNGGYFYWGGYVRVCI